MKPSLASTVPDQILRDGAALRVVEFGFGAGPGFVATSITSCNPPVSLDEALAYLERYRTVFRKGHIRLADGTRLMFSPSGYMPPP